MGACSEISELVHAPGIYNHPLSEAELTFYQDFVDVSHIKCNQHVIAIQQTPSEFAIYMELVDHVLSNEFQNNPIRSGGDDKAKQIKDVTDDSEDGKIALFLRASSFGNIEEDDDKQKPAQNASDMCHKIAALRDAEYAETLQDFEHEYKKAYWLSIQTQSNGDPCNQFKNWKDRAQGDRYGDHETSVDIRRVICMVESKYAFEDWKLFYHKPQDNARGDAEHKSRSRLPVYPEGMTDTHGKTHLSRVVADLRSSTSRLNKTCEQLVIRTRSLRVFRSVRAIQGTLSMSCSMCCKVSSTASLTLLGRCGHVICTRCKVSSVCGVSVQGDKCMAVVAEHQRIPCASLRSQTATDRNTVYGSKIDYVVALIKNKITDHEIKDDEKVLLFVQHQQTQQKLEEAFDNAKISWTNLNNKISASTNLKQFQNDTGKMTFTKVLIMNTGDESAAGR